MLTSNILRIVIPFFFQNENFFFKKKKLLLSIPFLWNVLYFSQGVSSMIFLLDTHGL